MATLEELQAQRQRTIEEIQRRRKAGQAETPTLSARLADLEGQIRQARAAGPQPTEAPPVTPGPAVADATAQNVAQIPKTIDNVQQGVQADIRTADISADKQIALQNPNTTNPFGSQTVTRGPDGSVNVEQKLDAAQQGIVDSGAKVSQTALDQAFGRLSGFAGDFKPEMTARQNADQYGTLAGQFQSGPLTQRTANTSAADSSFKPELTARTMSGDLVQDRRRIEDTVFNNLTRNMERDYKREKDNLEQSLANRGIPINPQDPQYQEAMRQMNERFDTQRQSAMAQAVQMGGDEYSRSFGIGETMRANDFGIQQGTRAQNLNEFGTLSGLQESQRANDFNQGLAADQANMDRVSTRFNMGETMRANDLNNQMAVRGQNYNEIAGLSNLGPGARIPQFQGYQGPTYQLTPATGVAAGIAGIQQGAQQIGIQQKQAQAQINALNRQGGGGGGGGTTGGQPTPPPFPVIG